MNAVRFVLIGAFNHAHDLGRRRVIVQLDHSGLQHVVHINASAVEFIAGPDRFRFGLTCQRLCIYRSGSEHNHLLQL